MRLYLAGPDVFRPNANVWGHDARALLAAHGHEALLPLDTGETTAAGIFAANLLLIRSADALIANLQPFRGFEPDSGTCFEVGYAVAIGKPVIGYLSDARPLLNRFAEYQDISIECQDRAAVDWEGFQVEDFGLPVNLMLAVPCRIVAGGLREALFALSDAR